MRNGRIQRRRFMSLLLSLVLFASIITVPIWDSEAAASAYRALERVVSAAQVLYRTASGEVYAAIVDGALEVSFQSASTAKFKLRIAPEGSNTFSNHDFKVNKIQRVTLKSQANAYTIQICENISGTKYRIAHESVVRVSANVLPVPETTASGAQTGSTAGKQAVTNTYTSSNSSYLASVDQINWTQGMACVQKALELASGKTSNREKAEAVYNYLVDRMSYDMSKVGKLPSSYKPDLDSVYANRKGICYDIAALYAGMLRAVGVPTKLIMGYTSMVQGYHAWNQVDLGDGKWHNVDVTTDCQLRGYGESTSFSAPKGTFSAVKEY